MRTALSIFLLCLLSHQLLLKLGIVAWYEWNKDYVAQNLCENRDKPQLRCCGKCYLHKQLAKADASARGGKPALAQLLKLKLSPFVMPQTLQLTPATPGEGLRETAYREPYAEAVTLAVIQPPG